MGEQKTILDSLNDCARHMIETYGDDLSVSLKRDGETSRFEVSSSIREVTPLGGPEEWEGTPIVYNNDRRVPEYVAQPTID